MNYSDIIDLLLDNIKKMVFPEDWLNLDMTLSKQEIFALLLMDRHGEIIMSQIAEYVNISMSTATGIIDRLVKNGYCTRRRSESDRRVVMIAMTKKAENIIIEVKKIGQDYFDRVFNALTPEEQQFLFSIITKIFKVLSDETAAGIKNKQLKQKKQIQKIAIE